MNAIQPAITALLHRAQKGSISGRIGADHITELSELFYSAVEDSEVPNVHILFIDTKKAFDSIHHGFIIASLKRFGFPSWVINIIKALLHEVAVTPVFNGYTGVWIPIKRGVKQGCPLSPLIFAICMDSLLHKLDPTLKLFAYVDDLAIATNDWRDFHGCMVAIDAFSAVSGLGINRSKTAILSARPDVTLRAMLCNGFTRWCMIKYVTEYKYLGVYFGPDINLAWIYYDACLKCATRLASYSLALRNMTPFKRILVYNVFVFPLFSYLAQYYPIAVKGDASLETVSQLISRYIVPFRSGFKAFHLVAPKAMISPPVPCLDLWSYSVMCMAVQGVLSDRDGDVGAGSIERKKPSMRISVQISEMTAIFVESDVSDARAMTGDNTKTFLAAQYDGPKKRRLMYDTLVRCQLRDSKSSKDLLRVLTVNRGLQCTSQQLDQLHSYYRMLPSKMPAVIRYFNFMMIFNANVTSQRVRYIRAKESDSGVTDTGCWLCGSGLDHMRHILAECRTVERARRVFCYFTNIPIDHHELKAEDAWHGAMLITNKPTTAKHATAVFVFNWAAWYVIRTLYQGRANVVERTAANDIASRALDAWSKCALVKWGQPRVHPSIMPYAVRERVRNFGSAGRRSDHQTAAALAYAVKRVNAVPKEHATVYTDGSSYPSKATGAGILIQLPVEVICVPYCEAFVALDNGTNNIGELCAIGIGMAILLHHYSHLTGATFFTDSGISQGLVLGTMQPTKNIDLVHALRKLLARLRTFMDIQICWVGGHIGLPGNDTADALADMGAKASTEGRGIELAHHGYDFVELLHNSATKFNRAGHPPPILDG